MSDRLAKSLDAHLHVAVGSDKDVRRRLLNRGWKTFINSDRPDTNSPAEMASHAVLYLGLHNDQWTNEVQLILAVFSFLKAETKQESKLEPRTLLLLLNESPVAPDMIHQWFAEAFR